MARDAGSASLLASDEPAIRRAARVDLLERAADAPDVQDDARRVREGRIIAALLAGMQPDGTFPGHPYLKWQGAHWRLVSLMDLGVLAADEPRLVDAYGPVLAWLGPEHRARVPIIDGRARRCGSQEGNALRVGVHLGLAHDARVATLASSLVAWQWPDGGWNCDKHPEAHHSSFNETWHATIGLAAFAHATGDEPARAASERAAEFVLRHHVVLSERTGLLVRSSMGKLHQPPFWHYDLLAGLRAVTAAGAVRDPRAAPALDLLVDARRSDGTWHPGDRWWQPPGRPGSNVEVVDWGSGAGEVLTLHALRVLKAAGRWHAPT